MRFRVRLQSYFSQERLTVILQARSAVYACEWVEASFPDYELLLVEAI